MAVGSVLHGTWLVRAQRSSPEWKSASEMWKGANAWELSLALLDSEKKGSKAPDSRRASLSGSGHSSLSVLESGGL